MQKTKVRDILWKRLKAIHVRLEQNKKSLATLLNIQSDLIKKLKFDYCTDESSAAPLVIDDLIIVKEILGELETKSVDLPVIFSLIDDASISIRAAIIMMRGH